MVDDSRSIISSALEDPESFIVVRAPFGRASFAVFAVCVGGGVIGSLWAVGGYFCGCLSTNAELFGWVGSLLLWAIGALFLPPPLSGVYLLVPFVLPIVGTLLVASGILFVRIFKRSDYLADDPTSRMILHPPRFLMPKNPLSLDAVLAHDRQIVSAGDILRWGDISFKQALIDRLAAGEVTPRVIRILRGARNDPDEEVRLFANTILTRIEKQFQERIKQLKETPDPLNPEGSVGRAALDYAVSGLMGDRLARTFLDFGLSCYEHAFRSEEPFSSEEVFKVGATAVALRNKNVVTVCRRRLERQKATDELRHLRWILLYEEGSWDELRNDLSTQKCKSSESVLPPHLLLWKDLPDWQRGEIK